MENTIAMSKFMAVRLYIDLHHIKQNLVRSLINISSSIAFKKYLVFRKLNNTRLKGIFYSKTRQKILSSSPSILEYVWQPLAAKVESTSTEIYLLICPPNKKYSMTDFKIMTTLVLKLGQWVEFARCEQNLNIHLVMTCDTWWGVNILSKFQLSRSYGFGKTVY